MLEFFDRNRVPLGRFENAFAVQEQRKMNAVSRLFFSLPKDDPKNEYCLPFTIVSQNKGEKYRIIRVTETEDSEDISRYECEHVLGMLIDTPLDGYHVIGNIGVFTKDVINYILRYQSDWVLYECDFSRQFEYGFEKETCLSALFSVPNRFTEKYMFKTDSTVYPFRLSLKRIDETAEPKARARKGYNRISLTKEIDYAKIVTKIIPYGAGEGDNQVTIKSVNGGLNYLQSPQNVIDKYGGRIIAKIWSDRRFTSAQELKNEAQALLNELQEPYLEHSVDFIEDCDIGDIVEIVGVALSFVTEVKIDYDELVKRAYNVANKTKDIAASIADLADRQNIETCYSQGASQIWSGSTQTNADQNDAATLSLYIPSQLLILNSVNVKIKMSRYRGEVATTSSGGSVQTSSSGGGSSSTSSSGGGGSTTSEASSKNTSDINGAALTPRLAHTRNAIGDTLAGHLHDYSVQMLDHTHGMSHTHAVNVPSHSHSFSVPAHTHTLNTTHNHTIEPKFTYYGSASGFQLQINGVNKAWVPGSNYEADISQLLANTQGMIPRGSWITIGCLPNDRARFDIAFTAQGFIQSRGGGQY